MTLAERRLLCEEPHTEGCRLGLAARAWLPVMIEALDACDHLVCPTDHHTLGCLCSCAECHRRQAARARLHEVGR